MRMISAEAIPITETWARVISAFTIDVKMMHGPVMYIIRSTNGVMSVFFFLPMRYPARMMRKRGMIVAAMIFAMPNPHFFPS